MSARTLLRAQAVCLVMAGSLLMLTACSKDDAPKTAKAGAAAATAAGQVEGAKQFAESKDGLSERTRQRLEREAAALKNFDSVVDPKERARLVADEKAKQAAEVAKAAKAEAAKAEPAKVEPPKAEPAPRPAEPSKAVAAAPKTEPPKPEPAPKLEPVTAKAEPAPPKVEPTPQPPAALPPQPVAAKTEPVQVATAPARAEPVAAAPAAQAAAAADSPARILSREDPSFPREAVQAGVSQGTVKARMTIDAQGRVTRVDIVDATPRRVFDRAVRTALSNWRFDAGREGRTAETEVVFKQ